MSKSAISDAYDIGVQRGEQREQARIIKLLEQYTSQVDPAGKFAENSANAEWIRGFAMAIALIKGEK